MKVLVYWHDMFLPHSAYLIKAFDQSDLIDQAILLGPEVVNPEAIFNQAGHDETPLVLQKTTLIKVRTYRFNVKCCRLSEYKKYIKQYQPDRVLVIDEALSLNVLLAGLACRLSRCQAKVLFYGFDNILDNVPLRYFLDQPSFSRLKVIGRKAIRYWLLDKLLMPLRRRLVVGGLTSYQECTAFIHQHHWYPTIAEQWWPIDWDNFADPDPGNPNNPQINELKAQQKNIVAFVGRFVPEKGIEDLINAVADLDSSYVLLLIGSGQDQPLLKKLVDERQSNGRVLFISPQHSKGLAAYFSIIDLLVLPSRTDYFWKEQYGRILVEAMASRTLVLGSDSGAIPYVIGDERFVFPEKNVQALKEKIAFIFENELHKENALLAQNKSKSLQADPQRFIEAFCRL